jgi:hypothetical protein
MSDVKRLLDEATPLPWTTHGPTLADFGSYHTIYGPHWKVGEIRDYTDTKLVLHAVNHLPEYEAAVDAIEALLPLCEGLPAASPIRHRAEKVRAALARLREVVAA